MNKLFIKRETLKAIQDNGEKSYPEEGAGLIFGLEIEGTRKALAIFPIQNAREDNSRHNRYLITAKDMMKGEIESEKLGFDVIGIFHSHPDHPDQPSAFDREWALPWYSYIITSVEKGIARSSLSWRLKDDRAGFTKEIIEIIKK